MRMALVRPRRPPRLADPPLLATEQAWDLSIRLSASEAVVLHGSFPISEQEWGQLLRILEVLKPGLVMPPLSLQPDDPDAGAA